MKLKFIFLLLFVCAITGMKAQSTDEYISDLLERADWFGLEEVYPKKKAELQSEMIKRLAEVMLYVHFNQPDVALRGLDTLLTYHQSELGLDNVYHLIALKSRLYAAQGLYQEASDNCAHFLNQLSTFNMSKENFPTHLFLEKYYDEIAYIPKPEINRPEQDIEIPLSVEETGYGKLLYIPVTVHGKEYRFMLDPGAGFTFLSDRMAKEMNVHIANDLFEVEGIGKSGVIDSMQIGGMTAKNILVLVGASGKDVDGSFQPDAVLGFDFFRLIGESHFFPEKGKMIFPVKYTKRPKSGRNLMIDNNQFYLKTYSGRERLTFRLGVGSINAASLYDPYYLKHKEFIESKGSKEIIREGGSDSKKAFEAYHLPQFSLKIGKKKFKLKNIPVFTEKVSDLQQNEDGALGMDFITQFKKVVINFSDMFVEVK